MKYRRLGRTDQQVSVIGFGGASISGQGGGYGFGKITETQAMGLVEYSFANGINLFDTAPLYGKGLSERRLGKALKAVRDKVFIISKCGITWKSSGRIDHHNDPDVCLKMLEQSLRDLQSDYIDLYMVHYPDPKVDIRYPVEVLAKAQLSGKIRFLGLCNTNQEELELAEQVVSIDVVQNEFHFFHSQETEKLFPSLKKSDKGLMGWGTLHKGVLTGTATPDRQYDSCDVRSWAPWFRKEKKILKQMQWANEVLLPRLEEQNIHPSTFALQFSLGFSELSCALCGFRSEQQLNILLQGIEQSIPKSVFQELHQLYESS